MTEAFQRDPGDLMDRAQAAAGDRLFYRVPGYDPGQLVLALMVPPADNAPVPVKIVSGQGEVGWTVWDWNDAGIYSPPDDYPIANGDSFDCRAQGSSDDSTDETHFRLELRPGNPTVPWLPGLPTPPPTPGFHSGEMVAYGHQITAFPWIVSGMTPDATGIVVTINHTDQAFFATRRLLQ